MKTASRAQTLLPELRQTLDTFVADSLRTFLEISRVFPTLEKKMADEIDEANAVIEHFFWNLEPGAAQGLASRLQTHEHSLLENTRAMADILERDLEQLEGFFKTISETRRIETQLKEIRQLSKDIKVYAINSIVVSAKSGVRGEGYRALSKFFIQFSSRSRTQIEELSNASRTFFSVFDTYEKELRELSTHDADLVRQTRHNLSQTFEGLMGSFKEFSRVFHELFDRVGANRQAIRNMITRIQIQDILQQQLQHVVQILSAWEKAPAGPRHLDLAAGLCELNRRQVAAIKAEVSELLKGLEKSLLDLESNLRAFQEDRTLLFAYMVEPNRFDAAPAVDRLMDRAMETLTSSIKLFQDSLAHRHQAEASGETLSGALGDLEPHFVRFAETTNLFTHMNFIAKKEVAQYDVFRESETSLSRDVMDALSIRMGATLTEAETFYQRSRKDLGQHLGIFHNSLTHHDKVLQQLMEATHASQETLEQSRTVLRESLVNISSFAGDLISEVRAALTGVRRLGHVVEVLSHLETRLEEVGRGLASDLSKEPGPRAPLTGAEVAPFLACYSVTQEREIARDLFPDLPQDTGGMSGQVELF